jgi:uncharacterized membrane protein (DUF485 family)
MRSPSPHTTKVSASRHLTIIQPILVFALAFTVQNFLTLLFHEGGHALVPLVNGEKIILIIHPFAFTGYARPIWDYNNIWTHLSGPLVGILIPLLIFIPLWNRRSTSLLPLLLPFAFGTLLLSVNILMPGTGDFNNLIQITGMSAIPIRILGLLLFGIGIFLTISLFPLFGLAPEDKKSLIIVPGSFFLIGGFGWIVTRLFVPTSSVLLAEGLVEEVMTSSIIMTIVFSIIGFLLALIYISLYRWIYRKLPAGLRTETVNLTWKDLRLPAVLSAICVILGLIIIT